MYGRHRNGLGIDPETGEGTVTGLEDGREYEIGPRADLRGADLRYADLAFANLTDADLVGADLQDASLTDAFLSGAKLEGAKLAGASFRYATVDPKHIPLIEEAARDHISTIIKVGFDPHPGYGHLHGRRR